MKFRFLCANHRRWLVADPRRAERALLAALEQGQGLEVQQDPQLALGWFGCAFELAECLLAQGWPEQGVAVQRFSECARRLLATGWRLGDRALCNRVVELVRRRLWQEQPGRAGGGRAAVDGLATERGVPGALLH